MNDILIMALFTFLIVIGIAVIFISVKQEKIEIQLIRINKDLDRYIRQVKVPEEYEKSINKLRNPNLGGYQPNSNSSPVYPPSNPPNQDTAGKPPNSGSSIKRNGCCKCR